MPSEVPSARAARCLVAGLVAAGVRDVCITPGSRSTPLVVAFARHPGVRAWLHLDERSSSYFALGLARARARPVAVVCTSGTAAANLHPAVAEAGLSRIPLIVLTADRPPRLREVGADQTIPQPGMFGSNVRWAHDLPVPHGAAGEDAFLQGVGERSVRLALGPLPGPVHLNLPYEEPLIDAGGTLPDGARAVTAGEVRRAPCPPPAADIEAVAARLRKACRRPLIVAGPETGGLPARPLAALAARLGAPIVADALSGLRTGSHDRKQVLDAGDALFRDPRADRSAPDAVIRFGGRPVSKPLNQYLARLEGALQVLCDFPGSWRDADATAAVTIPGDPDLVAGALEEALAGFTPEAGWLEGWLSRNDRAGKALRDAAGSFAEPFEGRVFLELQKSVPAGSTIVAGNSMPVRDLDTFLAGSEKPLFVWANRGANGIDGVVSSALGAAAAGGPTFLVIGDLSFYHDLNGLWAARRHGLDLTVVLVNNEGGGIFHYLPQADHGDVFEEWFATPSGLDFALAVEMYGGSFLRPGDWAEFGEAIATQAGGLRVIELRTDRRANVRMHREAWAAAAAAAWGEEGAG